MDTQKLEIRVCPFCGNIPKLNLSKKTYCQLHGEEHQGWTIKCCVVTIEKDTKEQAIKYWNGDKNV